MRNRITWGIMSAVMFISAGVLIFYFFWANGYIDPPSTSPSTEYTQFTYPSLPSEIDPSEIAAIDVTDDFTDKSSEDHKGWSYVCPVDFAQLQAANPDIIGWFYMTNPYISQPILRSPVDDSYYLSHNAEKEYDRSGALYVESNYNTTTLDDLVTVIYGHRMSSGAMFGSLQSALSDVDLTSNPQFIVIYTPKNVYIYQICATIPRDKTHILYYNDFNNESVYTSFINNVYSSTASETDLVDSIRPQYGDKLIILSTCLRRDRTQRFLVIAKRLN